MLRSNFQEMPTFLGGHLDIVKKKELLKFLLK